MATSRLDKFRDWPNDQLDSLIALLNEIRSPRRQVVNRLYQYPPGETAASDWAQEDVSDALSRLAAHPMWRSVSRDTQMKALLASFKRNLLRRDSTLYPRTEFRFLYFVFWSLRFYRTKPKKLADWKTREKAVKAIRLLRRARNQGVSHFDPVRDSEFERLLCELERQLQVVGRKVYQGPKYHESETLRRFAWASMDAFGDTSSTVLRRFAEFAGFDFDDSALEKLLKNARAVRAKRLALQHANPSE